MTMDNKEKNSNIERLLQAVERPEGFDEEQLDAIMNGEDARELYSLLSDIEAINAVDHSQLPDVEAEWSNFARWRRKKRIARRSGKLRRISGWSAYVSVAAVIIFALFVAVPLLHTDTAEGAVSIAAAIEKESDEAVVGTDDSRPHYGQLHRCTQDFRYRAVPALHGSEHSTFGLFYIQAQGQKKMPSAQHIKYWPFDDLGPLDAFSPYLMSSEIFSPIRFTSPGLSPADKFNWNGFYKKMTLDW